MYVFRLRRKIMGKNFNSNKNIREIFDFIEKKSDFYQRIIELFFIILFIPQNFQ